MNDRKRLENRNKEELDKFGLSTAKSNNEKNRNTISSRLSDLMFGSLLASFILGFIAYPTAESASDPGYTLGLVRALTISITFTIYTSFFYLTYQQNIFNMQINIKYSSYDFFVAITLGFAFGLSLYIRPFTPAAMIGCMTLASWRGRYLLKKYHESLVENVKYKLGKDGNIHKITKKLEELGRMGGEDSLDERIRKKLSEKFKFSESENAILSQWQWRSWHRAFLYWSIVFLVGVFGILLALRIFVPTNYEWAVTVGEITILAGAALSLGVLLVRRVEDMPDAATASLRLDSALVTALGRVEGDLLGLAQDER